MNTFKLMLVIAALVFCGSAAELWALEVEQPAPNFTLTDTKGAEHRLSDFQGKYVVLEWTNYDCPFVRKHYDSQNMQGLQKTLTADGVVWLSINSSAPGKQGHFSAEEVNQKIAEQGAAPTAYLVDSNGEVGRLYGAQTTPHMFLIDPQGTLIYQGAIDSIASADQTDIPKAENYLSSAYAEAKSGQAIATVQTKSYGCSVKY